MSGFLFAKFLSIFPLQNVLMYSTWMRYINSEDAIKAFSSGSYTYVWSVHLTLHWDGGVFKIILITKILS